ncbi:MAG: type II toxin-antitoxin system prevent-host-death family antitoxin [Acidobacteriota bacterium]|nr:type II toxin-antitoxin system prevent-host-death family antitoxin [Acidobacteriota bacterium]
MARRRSVRFGVAQEGAFRVRDRRTRGHAHLPQLLKRVRAGERFVITRHDRPIAELIPYRGADTSEVRTAIEDLKAPRSKT